MLLLGLLVLFATIFYELFFREERDRKREEEYYCSQKEVLGFTSKEVHDKAIKLLGKGDMKHANKGKNN